MEEILKSQEVNEFIQEDSTEDIIRVKGVSKQYRLGAIGGATLREDLQSWWAKVRKKEDPNLKIGEEQVEKGKRFWALKDININIKKQEAVGIIGHNGAGKSTLLKLLSRVTAPTEGEIYMNGRIASMLEVGTGFHPEMTGRENVYLNGAILGMTKAEIDKKIEDIIDFAEIRQFIDTPVKRYSSGMYVKLAFSVAAHLDSEIMIMDEVLAVGDAKFQQKCLKKMREVCKNEGRTVLYVSHNVSTIRQLCDRCIVLSKGQVVYDGDVDEAINIYLGNRNPEGTIHFDLDNIARHHPKGFHITSLDLLDVENNEYDVGSEIKFNLKWIINGDITEAYFRFMIRDMSENYIGVAFSDKLDGLEYGHEYSENFIFKCDNLVPGQYKITILVDQRDSYGNIREIDGVGQAFTFIYKTPKNKKKTLWQRAYWGSVNFGSIKKIDK